MAYVWREMDERERRALVAERVMGWTDVKVTDHPVVGVVGYIRGHQEEVPLYSTDPARFFEIDKPGWLWTFDEYERYLQAEVAREDGYFTDISVHWSDYPDKAAAYLTARCVLALRACGVEVEA